MIAKNALGIEPKFNQSAMASLFDLVNENPEFVDEQLHIRFKEIGLNRSFLGKVMEIDKNGPNGKVLFFPFLF